MAIIECADYNEYVHDLLIGQPCVLAYNTAADYLGLSNGGLREHVEIFVEHHIDIPTTKQFITLLKEKNIQKVRGLWVTTLEQTIIDLLEYDDDNQIIQETMAAYYFEHDESFGDLKIPPHLKQLYEKYADWAIHYYDD